MSKIWRWVFFIAAFTVVISILILKSGLLNFLSQQGAINPNSLTGNFDSNQTEAIFDNQKVSALTLTSQKEQQTTVLGENAAPKRIEIDLTNQRLYAFSGDQKIYDFAVSSGKWSLTPTGNFHIWIKLRYTLMTGGTKLLGTYYYLPNVPYVMFFYNDETPQWKGYGIHGAYWHNNFGHPMSHGCINMKPEEAELLYYWAMPDLRGRPSIKATTDNPGTEVIIYGTTPAS